MSNFEFKREKYPTLPGVYIMKDKEGEIIYVGKASSLRSRLSQYFGTLDSPKTQVLVSKINSIEFVITKTEGEALILESNFIKSYKPKYNIDLKEQSTTPTLQSLTSNFQNWKWQGRILRENSE
jgi:excinuclease ABC subunit C